MQHIETEIIINAQPDKVWSVLTNFENYPKWNPFIKSIEGETAVGKQLKVFIQPPNGSGMTFKPEVLAFDANKEFRWKGKLFVKGIFDGEHFFRLVDMGDGTTKFIHGENFSGFLVPFVSGILGKTKVGFELMNEALKRECEQV